MLCARAYALPTSPNRVYVFHLQARRSAEVELARLRVLADEGTVTVHELEERRARIDVKLKSAVEEAASIKADADRQMAAAAEREEAAIALAAAEKQARQAMQAEMLKIKADAAEGKLSQQQSAEQEAAAKEKFQNTLKQADIAKDRAEARADAAIAAKQKLEAQIQHQRDAMYLKQASVIMV